MFDRKGVRHLVRVVRLLQKRCGRHPVQDRSRLASVVEEGGPAAVTLYNLISQRVVTLHDGPVAAGERVSLAIDAGRLGAGTHFLRLTTEGASCTERVTVVRQ